jgi:hypothetical protein
MSDSTKAFLVILDEDLSEESSQQTQQALLHLRGVIRVEPHVHDVADLIAASRARHRLAEAIYEFLKDWK